MEPNVIAAWLLISLLVYLAYRKGAFRLSFQMHGEYTTLHVYLDPTLKVGQKIWGRKIVAIHRPDMWAWVVTLDRALG
jgi:hypothetical protein